jgi:AcrR family transcriptional regulator
MTSGTIPGGSLRADAERNRALIIDAARAAFAAEGVDVSMAEIARRAGVGFATAQRRFPTKQALIAEVLRAQLASMGEFAAPGGGGDAWQAFTTSLRVCCARQAAEPGLAGSFAQILSPATDADVAGPVADAFEHLTAGAKASGALRADASLDDVLLILKANAGVIANSPGQEAEASRRFVDLALDALRGRAS